MSDNSRFYAMLLMATHLRAQHGWTWTKLKRFFPGRGRDFWEMVRVMIGRMEDS